MKWTINPTHHVRACLGHLDDPSKPGTWVGLAPIGDLTELPGLHAANEGQSELTYQSHGSRDEPSSPPPRQQHASSPSLLPAAPLLPLQSRPGENRWERRAPGSPPVQQHGIGHVKSIPSIHTLLYISVSCTFWDSCSMALITIKEHVSVSCALWLCTQGIETWIQTHSNPA